MLKASAATMLALYLVGCNPFESEIDKCTNAFVKAAEPFKDKKDRAESEAHARYMCLEAASGKE
jgi:hypothetical protein